MKPVMAAGPKVRSHFISVSLLLTAVALVAILVHTQRVHGEATSNNIVTTISLATNAATGDGEFTLLPPVVFTAGTLGDILEGSR